MFLLISNVKGLFEIIDIWDFVFVIIGVVVIILRGVVVRIKCIVMGVLLLNIMWYRKG